jgi:hypothetical protein
MAKGPRRVFGILGAIFVLVFLCVQVLTWLMNSPIVFYGRVVDDTGRPCLQASVSALINRRTLDFSVPALFVPDKGYASDHLTVATDADGKFAIRGRGISLVLLHVRTKDEGSAGGDFVYTAPHFSNPAQPEVFKAEKPHPPLRVEHVPKE